MYRFYCIFFIKYTLAGKKLLAHINFSSVNDYNKNDKIIFKCFKNLRRNMSSLEFRLRKFDATRNYLLDVIKRNDLMS